MTDASLACPPDWRNRLSALPVAGEKETLGHIEQGGTIAIHSLAVAKEHQHKGLGSILLKSYIERIKSAKIAERISLLAHDDLVKFYQGFGFVDEGLSDVKIGPDPWKSMVSSNISIQLQKGTKRLLTYCRFLNSASSWKTESIWRDGAAPSRNNLV